MSIDLAAERARAAAKRERAALEARARLLLSGQWHLDAEGIEAAIAERYPQLDTDGAADLLRTALLVQEHERPRRIPIEAVDAKRPEAEAPRARTERGAQEKWDRIHQGVLDVRKEARTSRPAKISKQEDAVAKANPTKLEPEELRRLIRITLTSERDITQTECRRLIESRTGTTINVGTFNPHWKFVREELGMDTRDERRAKRKEPKAVKKAAPAKSEAKDPTPEPRTVILEGEEPPMATAAAKNNGREHPPAENTGRTITVTSGGWGRSGHGDAVLEEVRSLRALFEGRSYVRVEEQDGEYVVSTRMVFSDLRKATRAVASLAGFS